MTTLLLTLWACAPKTPDAVTPPTETAATAPGLPAPETRLPRTPDLVEGTLDNGLAWYVRPNTEPAARAELRLVVKVGSVYEDDDQQGLAHLLEHMAFNGTATFAEDELVATLEGLGMGRNRGVGAAGRAALGAAAARLGAWRHEGGVLKGYDGPGEESSDESSEEHDDY